MRKTIILTALVLAVIAAIMATRSTYYYAYIPGLLAIALGFYGMQLSKDHIQHKKTAQLAILLGGLAICLSSYNLIFSSNPESIPSQATEKIEESIPEEEEEMEEDFSDEELDAVENEIMPSIKKIDSVPPPANIIKK
ncbi:hypothetical protein ACFFVB_06940 [Formosa undariae]|uniref:FUSC family protein n=1 Tax=Formosa undariae TaxID=1325436 RepID=A0ABV5F068_9FLAO